MDSDSSSDEEDEEINEDIKPILHVCFLIDIIAPLHHKTQVFQCRASYVDIQLVMCSVATFQCIS